MARNVEYVFGCLCVCVYVTLSCLLLPQFPHLSWIIFYCIHVSAIRPRQLFFSIIFRKLFKEDYLLRCCMLYVCINENLAQHKSFTIVLGFHIQVICFNEWRNQVSLQFYESLLHIAQQRLHFQNKNKFNVFFNTAVH